MTTTQPGPPPAEEPHPADPARRIVQIAACAVDNVSTTQCHGFLYALDDRGRAWEMRIGTGAAERPWIRLPALPGGDS